MRTSGIADLTRTRSGKPRVLLVVDTLCVGGAERSMLELTSRMREATPIVCQLYPGADLKPAFESAGVRVIALDLSGRYDLLRAVRRVRDLVRKERIDVIHAALYRAGLVARLVGVLTRTPVLESIVSDSYGPTRFAQLTVGRRLKLRATRLAHRLTAPLATHWVANSETVKASHVRALRIPPRCVTVIHRGRDAATFCPNERRATQGTERERSTIIIVGRLVESKGHQDLIAAMPRVLKRVPNARLLIVGEGPFRDTLQHMIRERGLDAHVELLGQRADVAALLRNADMFAFASHLEGHSGAVIEAMLSGLPIVASDIPPNKESLEHGTTGHLVDVGNVDGYANAIVDLLGDYTRATAMGARARQAAIERFSIEGAVRRHEELYRALGANLRTRTDLRRAAPTRERYERSTAA